VRVVFLARAQAVCVLPALNAANICPSTHAGHLGTSRESTQISAAGHCAQSVAIHGVLDLCAYDNPQLCRPDERMLLDLTPHLLAAPTAVHG
jgi:hypothetical protein